MYIKMVKYIKLNASNINENIKTNIQISTQLHKSTFLHKSTLAGEKYDTFFEIFDFSNNDTYHNILNQN